MRRRKSVHVDTSAKVKGFYRIRSNNLFSKNNYEFKFAEIFQAFKTFTSVQGVPHITDAKGKPVSSTKMSS